MPELRHKPADTKNRLRMEIKEISSSGEFEGRLSVYGNVDDGSDMVEPGAFTKTIQERGGEVPLLWQHDPSTPIGMLSLVDAADALHVKGNLLMDLDEAKKAYLLIKAGIVKGLSIGFETVKKEIKDGVRHLKELKLFEGSIVTFPMNSLATITNVKQAGDGPGDFNGELTEVMLRGAHCDYMQALDEALCGARYSALPDDEIVTAAGTIIDQFKEAYLAYLPAYLNLMNEMTNGVGYMGRQALELKAGRTISAATREKMQNAIDLLNALLTEEAGSSTSESEAAKAAPSEPVADHSAAESLMENIRALIPAA